MAAVAPAGNGSWAVLLGNLIAFLWMVFKKALSVLASLAPKPTALHVYVTGRGEDTSYVKLKVEQRSILKGPLPTVISGAVGTAGLSTAIGVDAEKDERPLAD